MTHVPWQDRRRHRREGNGDAEGTVLEINKVALDAVGIQLADVEGRPFWTTFWWQVSEEINQVLRESIARAAQGEVVRWDTAIYGRAGGKETIIIDASLCPVFDDSGQVVFICAEGRDITERKAQEREIAQKNIELQGLLERIRELDEIKTQFFANVSHELRTPLALIVGPAQRLPRPAPAHRAHRIRPGLGPPEDEGRRLRRSSGEAGQPRGGSRLDQGFRTDPLTGWLVPSARATRAAIADAEASGSSIISQWPWSAKRCTESVP